MWREIPANFLCPMEFRCAEAAGIQCKDAGLQTGYLEFMEEHVAVAARVSRCGPAWQNTDVRFICIYILAYMYLEPTVQLFLQIM